ncbi:hypothetical protein BC828DRAFT_394603, partial [Blastocladiella britannica]
VLSSSATGASCDNHSYPVLWALVTGNGAVWALLTYLSSAVTATVVAATATISTPTMPAMPVVPEVVRDQVPWYKAYVHVLLRVFKTVWSPRTARHVLYFAVGLQVFSMLLHMITGFASILGWVLVLGSMALILTAVVRMTAPLESVRETYELAGDVYHDVTEFDLADLFDTTYMLTTTTAADYSGKVYGVVTDTTTTVLTTADAAKNAVVGQVIAVNTGVRSTVTSTTTLVTTTVFGWYTTTLAAIATMVAIVLPIARMATKAAMYLIALYAVFKGLEYAYVEVLTEDVKTSMQASITGLVVTVLESKDALVSAATTTTSTTTTTTTVTDTMTTESASNTIVDTVTAPVLALYETATANLGSSSYLWIILALNVALWMLMSPLISGPSKSSTTTTTTTAAAAAPAVPAGPGVMGVLSTMSVSLASSIPNLASLLIPVLLLAGFFYPSLTGTCNMFVQSAINLGLLVAAAKFFGAGASGGVAMMRGATVKVGAAAA